MSEEAVILEITIKRKGWRANLTRRFKGCVVDLMTVYPLKRNLAYTSQLVTNIDYESLHDFLAKCRIIINFSIFPITDDMFLVITLESSHKFYAFEFIARGAFPLFLPTVENGRAKYLVLVTNPTEVIKLLENDDEVALIRKITSYKALEVIKKQMEKKQIIINMPNLSKRQLEILTYSLNHGFFEYPKTVTLKELSSKLGLPPSTILYNIRSAEKKILKWFISLKEYSKNS